MKKLVRYIGKSALRLRFYNSIDTLPIQGWFKRSETGSNKHIVRNDVYFIITFYLAIIPLCYLSIWIALFWILLGVCYKHFNLDEYFGASCWENIYDEFLSRIGPSDDYKDYIDRIKRIAEMQCDWVLCPSPADKIQIRRELYELKQIQDQKKVEYMEIVGAISKAQGFRIDPKIVTVSEFYGYIKANTKEKPSGK